jgi:acyl-CoA synthetase (NDP forming)
MIATAPAEHYRRVLSALGRHKAADAIIAIFIRPLLTHPAEVAVAIREGVGDVDAPVPVLAVFMTAGDAPVELSAERDTVPRFAFPEDAARALARAADYGVWRSAPAGETRIFEDARVEEAAALISRALAGGQDWLNHQDVGALLSCYGIRQPESEVVDTAEEAGRAAAQFGGKVALKAIAPRLLHKTDAGGVELSLEGAAATTAAAERMSRRVGEAGHTPGGYLVQQMVPTGVEMLVGVVHDPLFGPVVACGAGGIQAELLKDVAVRLTPLTDHDAREMITSLKTFALLDGFRGAPIADVGALEEVLLRVGALVENHPEIVEMDCNPVTVLADGAFVLDARVRVQEAAPSRPEPALRAI